MSDCLFCKLLNGDIPSDRVYEDEHCIAFRDIDPKAPTHLLVIPRKHIASLADVSPADEAIMGHMVTRIPEIARNQGLERGFRTVVNTGPEGGQEVYHIHFHILGGRQMAALS
ncbi:HIT domain-containing protein [Litorivicinus lipolyticus]|uniref:HIT domain-containing protein n=1 Tax=Litorivicinus lipolyticus TaxID=418701 RepID=A0A5Q2QAK6_9GAMM|nr:histidine triad nucleotide-binding protein [Litorivicinus lipolyticus]QGG79311.1 HIT domain-containing protein [Litorivicinus lipolyticus]